MAVGAREYAVQPAFWPRRVTADVRPHGAMCFAQVSSIDQVIAEIAQLSADTKAGGALPQRAARLG